MLGDHTRLLHPLAAACGAWLKGRGGGGRGFVRALTTLPAHMAFFFARRCRVELTYPPQPQPRSCAAAFFLCAVHPSTLNTGAPPRTIPSFALHDCAAPPVVLSATWDGMPACAPAIGSFAYSIRFAFWWRCCKLSLLLFTRRNTGTCTSSRHPPEVPHFFYIRFPSSSLLDRPGSHALEHAPPPAAYLSQAPQAEGSNKGETRQLCMSPRFSRTHAGAVLFWTRTWRCAARAG